MHGKLEKKMESWRRNAENVSSSVVYCLSTLMFKHLTRHLTTDEVAFFEFIHSISFFSLVVRVSNPLFSHFLLFTLSVMSCTHIFVYIVMWRGDRSGGKITVIFLVYDDWFTHRSICSVCPRTVYVCWRGHSQRLPAYRLANVLSYVVNCELTACASLIRMLTTVL